MSLTKYIGGLLILFLNFGRGFSGDEWPASIKCPGGESTESSKHQMTFDWDFSGIPKILKSLATSHQNFTRETNCGDEENPSKQDLCNPEKDASYCELMSTSICVRTATAELSAFDHKNFAAIFAMHDYYCDGTGNYFYYGVSIRERAKSATKFPLNLEPEINLVSTKSGKLLIIRLYFFHDLPDLFEQANYFTYGFVYIKLNPTKAIVNAIDAILREPINHL